MNPELTPARRAEEGRQALGAPGVEHAVYPALGDGAHLRSGDGEEVEDERERLPVEVAHALDTTVGQDYRVIRNGVEFAGRDPHGVIQRVAGRAVDLGGAA